MRAYIYARRSKAKKGRDGQPVEDEALSLAAQLRACRGECDKRGWTVVAELVEDDKSARYEVPTKRVLFQRLLAGVDAGEADVVVVHKLDRFSRNLRLTLQSLDRLAQRNVGLVSVVENLDYSTPQGRLSLHLFGALAQFYSENLGQEVRKVKTERKERGLYNGLLPFGARRGPDGIPVPDDRPLDETGRTNHQGLLYALQCSARGDSDTEVARALNAGGWRTTGNRGQNLWTKDTVRRLLLNRFYVGDLPDGQGGWIPGAHQTLVDVDLFAGVQRARQRNRTGAAPRSVNPQGSTYSLTGLVWCRCGAKIQFASEHGVPRTYCARRKQGLDCDQKSVMLSVYEEQVGAWLASIELPEDAVERALQRLRAEAPPPSDGEAERKRLTARLERIKELYGWGDLERADYLAERDELQAQLRRLEPVQKQRRDISRLAEYLRSVPQLWAAAFPQERNRLASRLIQRIVVDDARVVEITPRPEFSWLVPCYVSTGSGGSDGRRSSTTLVSRYLSPRLQWYSEGRYEELARRAARTSIAQAARELGASRQTVRAALAWWRQGR